MVDEVIENARCGERLFAADALTLLRESSLAEIAWAGDRVSSPGLPQRKSSLLSANEFRVPSGKAEADFRTYTIDRNINYTNICTSGCKFCAFFKRPGDEGGYVLSVDEVLARVEEAVSLGATQIMLQGGLNPDLDIAWFEELFRAIKSRHAIRLHSLSAPEIAYLAELSELSVGEVLTRLRDAGLDSLPGGGAEILTDSVRKRVSPHKCSTQEWLQVMREAAKLGMRATATMLIGLGESLEDRIAHLEAVRGLQDETGVFTAFIPWTFQPGNTALGGLPTGAHDYLKTLALSRLYLDNIAHIQASWVTQGRAIATLALRCGADDMGSVMLEENVVAAAGVNYRLSQQEIIAAIHDAGYKAARRDAMYGILECEVES